jgi:hypothetical protein
LKREDTNYKKQSIGITVIAVAIASLLIAGTILAPTQASALSKFNTKTDTSSLKHGIRDGVSVNLERRDQHMNQENLCYRTNTCRQSSVGQNTLGNDNSVTGFADQSDNLQQSATAQTPTTGNQTTPTPTPTPTPTTATLTVIKVVAGNTTATPANFTIHVTGNNPIPADFNGSATGTDVTLSPSTFNVTETASPNFTTTFSSECSGNITAGQHLTCTITNTAKTCEECFTSLLTQTQITAFLSSQGISSIPAICDLLAIGTVSESNFILALTSPAVGVSVETANELIACLKAAGIVFLP